MTRTLDHRVTSRMSATARALRCRCRVTVTVVNGKDGISVAIHRCNALHDWAVKELQEVAEGSLRLRQKALRGELPPP